MAGLDPRPLGRSGSPQPLAARRLDGRGWLAFASPQTSGQPRVDPQHLVASALRLFGATILPPALRKPPFSSGSLSGSSHTLMNSKRKTLRHLDKRPSRHVSRSETARVLGGEEWPELRTRRPEPGGYSRADRWTYIHAQHVYSNNIRNIVLRQAVRDFSVLGLLKSRLYERELRLAYWLLHGS